MLLSKRKLKQFLKQFSKPWITIGLKKSIKVKNSLFQSGNFAQYKLYRNKISALIRMSKKNYFHAFFVDNLYNMKNTWKGINSLIYGKKKKSRAISSLKRPNKDTTTDPLEISNIFNNYFSSVGEKLASRVPSSSCSFTDYLLPNIYPNSFFFDAVSPVDIESEILSIPKNKTYGLYSCPTHILSGARHIISGPLSNIFNNSVQEGIFPSKLKQAKVIPVYKSDDETEPGNYRPISLLSIFNRIFEKLMYKQVKNFLDKHNILFKSQYGFREKHSTQHAIIDIVNIIQNNMDLKLFTCGIFLDLKKAFDTVNHSILLKKLNHYGIRGVINDWFSSYLLGRTQVTEIDSNLSTIKNISCGVPQGSVLGPLLFLIYINDFHNSSEKFSFYLFADDTNLLYADKNLKNLEKTVNSELVRVSDWLNANKLTLNAKKSNFVIFRPYQRKMDHLVNILMFDNNNYTLTSLECKDHVKYLGVSLDSHLSWKYHIDNVALKISRIVGVIARLRHLVPFTTLLSIYRSLILPYLTYGLAAWGQAAKSHLQKILVLQKRVLRLMYFSEPRAHAVPLFTFSKILPLNMLYVETVASIMFDVSCLAVPTNISNLFIKANEKHNHETRFSSSRNFYINQSRLNQNLGSFAKFGAKLWNSICVELRQLPKRAFKKQIINMLFSLLEAEDDYVKSPILLKKIANYRPNIE